MTASWHERLNWLEAREDRNEEVDPRALHQEARERMDRVLEFAEQYPQERRRYISARTDELNARLALYPSSRRGSQVGPVTAMDRHAA